jgi:hypothetical protein
MRISLKYKFIRDDLQVVGSLLDQVEIALIGKILQGLGC